MTLQRGEWYPETWPGWRTAFDDLKRDCYMGKNFRPPEWFREIMHRYYAQTHLENWHTAMMLMLTEASADGKHQ